MQAIVTCIILLLCAGTLESSQDVFDQIVRRHVERIPELIVAAKEKVKDAIQFAQVKSHSQGYSILLGIVFDIGSDFIMFNRTLGNLYGSDDSIAGLHNHGNTLGSNIPDGLQQFHGLAEPGVVDSCKSSTTDFALEVEKWRILYPLEMPPTAHIEFEKRITANFGCLLKFADDYIPVAELSWALNELFTAITLRQRLL